MGLFNFWNRGNNPTVDTDPKTFTTPAGYATANYPYGGSSNFPYNPDELNPILMYPTNLTTLAQMEVDAQCAAITLAFHTMIRRVDVHIDPNGAPDDFVQLLSNDLGIPIIGKETDGTPNAARVPYLDHQAQALRATTFGHMPFELTVDVSGPIMRIKGIDQRHPTTISQIHYDPQGVIEWVQQPGPGKNSDLITIPGNRLLWYRLGTGPGVPQGTSMLRAAYRAWKEKDRLLRVLMISAERNGMGMPFAEMNDLASREEVEGGAAVAEGMRAGEVAGGAIKNGTMRLRGVEGQVHDILKDIQYLDSQITKVLLMMAVDLGSTGEGSHALAQVQTDMARDLAQSVANTLDEQFTNQVFRRLAVWQYGDNARVPLLKHGEIGINKNLPPAELAQLVQTGALPMDESSRIFVRRQYGFPAMDPGTNEAADGSVGTGNGAKVTVLRPQVEEQDDPGSENF